MYNNDFYFVTSLFLLLFVVLFLMVNLIQPSLIFIALSLILFWLWLKELKEVKNEKN